MKPSIHSALTSVVPKLLTAILMVALFGCTPPPPTPTATPTPTSSPTATSTLSPTVPPTEIPTPTATPCLLPDTPTLDPADEVSIQPSGQLPIRATSKNATSYSWNLQGDGALPSTPTEVAIYTAPEKSGGLATVSVKASNTCGETSTATLIIRISNMIVALDKISVPAGWMTSGDQNPTKYISMTQITTGCQSNLCYQFTYTPGNVYGGILWWPPSCGSSGTKDAWAKAKSDRCGIQVFKQSDVTPVKLTFWARGEKGAEVVEFMVGANDVKPSPAESTGKIVLGQTWAPHEILITPDMVKDATALFMWMAADLGNKEPITFYLDSIQYEGSR
jgi:hypothetical protein